MLEGFNLSLILETSLVILLGATLIYCALLEKRLRNLRQDQASLSNTIQALNSGILRAQKSLSALRTAATQSGQDLETTFGTARALADELSVLTAAGEHIASRIEAGRKVPAATRRTSPGMPSLSENLRAVR